MQAIYTKYIGPTNTRGSRIKATCARGSIAISCPHEFNGAECHREAVRQLIERFTMSDEIEYSTPPDQNPWNRPFCTGELPDGSCAHVFADLQSNTMITQFSDPDDYRNAERFIEECRTASGTVSGLKAGLACSAFKRSARTAI